jgi:hypothetical protein
MAHTRWKGNTILNNNQNIKNLFPDWVTEEALLRVLSHYEDGEFIFPLPEDEICSVKGNTVYHVIPRYADDGAEDIVKKLRRIMAYDLDNYDG